MVCVLGVDIHDLLNLYAENGDQQNQAEGQTDAADAPSDAGNQEIQVAELSADGNYKIICNIFTPQIKEIHQYT